MREHQGDNSDEIVLVDSVGSPEPRLQHVSGSAGWPDDVGDGGEHESLARDSPSTSPAWDEIQNLPTLEDAPLRADELRNKPSLEPDPLYGSHSTAGSNTIAVDHHPAKVQQVGRVSALNVDHHLGVGPRGRTCTPRLGSAVATAARLVEADPTRGNIVPQFHDLVTAVRGNCR